ncbi:hypothetical protein G7Y79_00047g082780 [Physcia stellaris]|nr:hypothetical protein G7Y79_00047g082780 [Physcia stellaris]
MMIPFSLTFGIEIEFVVAYHLEPIANPELLELGLFVRSHMVHVLREAGLSVNEADSLNNYDKWTIGTDGSIKAQPENPHSPEWNGFQFFPVELRSPTLFWDANAAAFQQVDAVLRTLHGNFRIFVNQSCGFHVHVGNRDLGFPRSTLMKFASLVTVFEQQFASLHPYHRVNNVHCRAPGSNFEGRDLLKNILMLLSLKSTHSLITHMSSNPDGDRRGFAYNMVGLIVDGEPPTIEFRQHEATLDFVAVTAWTSLACSLIEICIAMRSDDFSGLLSQAVDGKAYNIIELLVALGLTPFAEYYSQKTLYKHPQSDSRMKYEGEAWVSKSQSSAAPAIPSPASLQIDTFHDAELARRLALGLRTGARGVKGGNAHMPSHQETLRADADWETEYALFDVLREVDDDDEEDRNYR